MLDEYRRKRDPRKTPEPFGVAAADGAPRFVVQRHSARRLHYDLRLERDGVLASWAVPKGLPLDRGSRRRAIHTEDHPLKYLDFHGVIPKGQYGAGVMDVYDTGPYELVEQGKSGSLTFRLEGERLRGTWSLVPAHLEGEEKNWLLIRRDGGTRARAVLLPMLATAAAELPRGRGWLHEASWPGERLVARLDEGEPQLVDERGRDVTEQHRTLGQRLGRALRTFDCVVDGTVSGDVYFVSDLLELEGEAVIGRPLEERRALLEPLLDPTETAVRLSETFDEGEALLAAARAQGLSGVVSKRATSLYVPDTRSPDWIEVRADAEPEPEVRETELRRGKRSVRLSRLDYVWWPETGVRKLDLIAYYREVAPVLLPHLRGRPFTLKRYLNGPNAPFEWVKDAPPELPEWVPRCPLPAKSRRGEIVEYPLVNDELALVWLVDYGCIDLHLWFSRCESPSRPDYVLFDLDPARVPFADVVDAALLLREALGALGLESFVRTSGGEGLHVQVPVARRYSYEQTRRFAEIVADALVRARPDLVTVSRDVRNRRGVFVDTKMNGEGMTIASVYSARPLPGPTVATPLRWDELTPSLDPSAFSLRAVLGRVAEHGDLHADLLKTPQRLPADYVGGGS